MNKRLGLILLACSVLTAAPVAADTLMVVGVAVSKVDGRRMAGVTVRLVATSAAVGVLAEDRTSAQGVFNLYVRNIAGAIGDLYVVYDGPDASVTPLRVSVGPSRDGIFDVRPGDLQFLALAAQASLTADDASEHLAAVLQTHAVLVNAGVLDRAKSDQVVSQRSEDIRRRVPSLSPTNARIIENRTSERLKDFKLPIDASKAMAVIKRSGGK